MLLHLGFFLPRFRSCERSEHFALPMAAAAGFPRANCAACGYEVRMRAARFDVAGRVLELDGRTDQQPVRGRPDSHDSVLPCRHP